MTLRSRRPLSITAGAALLATAGLAVGLASCGSGDGGHAGHGGAASQSQPTASRERVELAFLRQMIPHHESAVEMARLIPSRSTHAEVRALGRDIARTQREEIRRMEGMLRTRNASAGDAAAQMDADAKALGLSMAAMGMHMNDDMLASAKPFDRAFLMMMIPHHEGAVRMAERVLAVKPAADVRTLATQIISAQEREIAEMKAWSTKWYGTESGSMDHSGMDHSAMGHGE